MLRRFSILAFGLALLVVACAGTHGAVPATPTYTGLEQAHGMAVRSAAGTATLSGHLAIVKPALTATTFKLYAYPLTAQGPLAKLPASALVLSQSAVPGKGSCVNAGNSTVHCTFSAPVPSGNDAIVAYLLDGTSVVARSFTAMTVNGSAMLSLVAGNVASSTLALTAPLAPTSGAFSVGVTPLNSGGATIMLGSWKSIQVGVYGPTGVVPAPQVTIGPQAATATFAVNGAFVNPMSIAAVVGKVSQTTRIFPNGSVPYACAPLSGTTVFPIPQPSIPSSFGMRVSIAGGKPLAVAMDTGSTTLAIARARLSAAQLSQLVGPGQFAQQTYYPSGVTIKGYYYLAPVTILAPTAAGGAKVGTTVPMEILLTTQACPKHGACKVDKGTAYLGVGFGRPAPSAKTSPGLMNGPMENAFLQLQGVVQGTMHPGFELTADSMTIGLNSTIASGVPTVQLSPFPGRAGDWNGPPACIGFNGAAATQCGSMLLDIGISSMFINASTPPPAPTSVQIVSPTQSGALLNYSFAYPVNPGATPPAPSPNSIDWETPTGNTYINTGRNALAAANYYYDAGCGTVGFQAVGSAVRRR